MIYIFANSNQIETNMQVIAVAVFNKSHVVMYVYERLPEHTRF